MGTILDLSILRQFALQKMRSEAANEPKCRFIRENEANRRFRHWRASLVTAKDAKA